MPVRVGSSEGLGPTRWNTDRYMHSKLANAFFGASNVIFRRSIFVEENQAMRCMGSLVAQLLERSALLALKKGWRDIEGFAAQDGLVDACADIESVAILIAELNSVLLERQRPVLQELGNAMKDDQIRHDSVCRFKQCDIRVWVVPHACTLYGYEQREPGQPGDRLAYVFQLVVEVGGYCRDVGRVQDANRLSHCYLWGLTFKVRSVARLYAPSPLHRRVGHLGMLMLTSTHELSLAPKPSKPKCQMYRARVAWQARRNRGRDACRQLCERR
jgi:hypothetical protein